MKKIENYINDLFKEVPKTRKSEDLKEELSADLVEKYQDLVKNGTSEKDAYQEVIRGIGDVDELLEELKRPEAKESPDYRKKTAFIVSFCVGLYILSLISVIAIEELLELPDTVSAISFFGISGIATCILVYHFMSIPKYQKTDNTFVEIRKAQKDRNDKNKHLLQALDTIVWLLTLIVYFLISFLFNCWYISWILFLVAPLVTTIIHLIVGVGEAYEK